MRIDIEYIKDLLERVLEHDKPDFDLNMIGDLWIGDKGNVDDEKSNVMIFHMKVLEDHGIIESATPSPGLGFNRTLNNGYTISVTPLRLTAYGHDFAAALNKPGVFQSLKSTFTDLGPSETIKAVFGLSAKALENQIDKIID